MDWKPIRYLATFSLTLLMSVPGTAGVGFPQAPQEQTGSSSQTTPTTDPASGKTAQAVGRHSDSTTTAVSDPLSDLPPMAQEFVRDYMMENRKRLERMKGRSQMHFRTIDNVFGKYGIPKELRYLAIIESDLSSTALSNKGALGPWQIMPETGRGLGLKVDGVRDERTDLVKSTHAAAKYLRSLHRQLGDWLLVIAAYNGGPGRVEQAIRQSNSRDFWKLQRHLPAESRNHVKKFIATHYIMEGRGGVTTGIPLAKRPEPTATADTTGTVEMLVTGRFNSFVMAKNLSMDIVYFNGLNPEFDRKVAMGDYRLRLPVDKMQLFNARRMDIVAESVRFLLENGSEEMDRSKALTEIQPVRLL